MSSQPYRILFVDHTASMGGGEVALLNLVRHLDRARFEPMVALLSDGPLVAKLKAAAIETRLVALSARVLNTRKDTLGPGSILRIREAVSSAACAMRLARLIARERVALVHTNSLKANLIGGLAARAAGVPLVWHVRDRICEDYLPAAAVHALRVLCRTIPDFVITNSAATLATLRLMPEGRAASIPTGIDLEARARVVHDGISCASSAPTFAQGDSASPCVGLVGRISPWKGQDVFLRAASVVAKRHPRVRFQIVGAALFNEFDYERQVRRLAAELGLEKRVEFTGFRDNVPELIAGMDVLVHASTIGEPFGQVIVEGMAAAKPVVATNGGGVPEIVVDGITGLLVPMGDCGAMARAVCSLLSDPPRCRRMGELARTRVRDHFTIEHTVAKVQRLYGHVINQHPVRLNHRRRGQRSPEFVSAPKHTSDSLRLNTKTGR